MPALIRAALALVIACGPRAAPPAQPRPLDPKQLAHQLHGDLVRLADLARRLNGRCDELIRELRPHVAAMRAHAAEAARADRDPELARQLKRELAAYDEHDRGLADAIGAELAASYLACGNSEQLRQLIDELPEL